MSSWRREPQLVDRIRELHVQERGGLVQALEMVVSRKTAGPASVS